MLVLKFIIALAIVCICAYVGISKAKKYESREYEWWRGSVYILAPAGEGESWTLKTEY